ncbi:MAG: DUF2149 domain-containing protein [Coriobacteriales bacterium]|jgi:hypothetical protein|nr:DUF2149 domain-containing protein [Coriobacteriales bacterium]
MARDFRKDSFLASEAMSAEDVDPRIGLVNLADVMLVFACGLMLALVTFWNLDVSAMQEVIKTEDVTEVTDIEQMQEQALGAGTGYQELGVVYQDPMTGKLYMLSEDIAVSAEDTSSASQLNSSTNDESDGVPDSTTTQSIQAQSLANPKPVNTTTDTKTAESAVGTTVVLSNIDEAQRQSKVINGQ